MPERNYWLNKQVSRRAILRGTGLGVTGLAGAALIGCGGDDDSGGSSGGTSTATGSGGAGSTTTPDSGNGAPANVTRAPGFDPASGISPINTNKMKSGGTFRRNRTRTTTQQDPEISIAGSDHELVNDRLVIANGWTMELTPDLLESYEYTDPQGLEIVLKLRPGIKMTDRPPVNGRTLTAADVAYSIERKAGILDPDEAKKYARAGQFVGLERAEAVDDLTVRLVMNEPNGAIMSAFSDPRASITSPDQDEIGYTDPLKFVGTGAWIETEFIEGTRQVFTPNPDYYRSFDEGGRPGIETLEYLVLPDRGTEVAGFITGELSVVSAVQDHEEPQIRSSVPDAQWFAQPNYGWYHWAVNLRNPIWQDDRVRQAIQLTQPYQQMGDAISEGWLYSGPLHVMFAEALTSDEIKAKPGYNPDTEEADNARALKLMAAAGYPEGEGIEFKDTTFRASGNTFDNAVRQKEHWSQIFPKMQMDIVPISDYASFTNTLNQREFEARTYHHTMVPNAVIDARTYYHSEGGRNYQSYEKPWADEILDKTLHAQSLEERIELFRQFEHRYIEEGPALLQLFVAREKTVYQSNFAGPDLVAGPWAYGLASYGVGYRWYWQTED